MKSLLLVAALALPACTADPQDKDKADTVLDPEETDSDAGVDTDPPAETDSDAESDPSPVDTDLSVPAGITVTQSGQITCIAPSLRVEERFDIRTVAEAPAEVSYIGGGGIAVMDVDGNTTLDIVVIRQSKVRLYRRQLDGELVPEDVATFVQTGREAIFGVSGADFDGDLDVDLFVSNYPGPDFLMINDGAGHFVERAAERGVRGPVDHHGASSTWADLDRDGDLDLIVAGHGWVDEEGTVPADAMAPADPTLLYENNGDGTFTDRSENIPEAATLAYTFNVAAQDFDGDGWLDLYFANDFTSKREPCMALRGHGLTFALGELDPSLDSTVTAMGLAIGDPNEDGIPDLVQPGWGELGFLVSSSSLWFEQGPTTGVVPDLTKNQRVAWGSEFADLDNDKDEDLVVTFGYLASRFSDNSPSQPDALYMQDSPMSFVDRAMEWGQSHRDAERGLALADMNRDGYVDIAKAAVDGRVRISESRCADRAWLQVTLRQPGLNAYGIGARVQIVSGDRTLTRWIRAGGTGYASSAPPEAHFGLDRDLRAEELIITWPDQQVTTVRNLVTRQFVTVERVD